MGYILALLCLEQEFWVKPFILLHDLSFMLSKLEWCDQTLVFKSIDSVSPYIEDDQVLLIPRGNNKISYNVFLIENGGKFFYPCMRATGLGLKQGRLSANFRIAFSKVPLFHELEQPIGK